MTPATPRGHSRIVLLFLIAVILPSLVLVLFAVRMIRQEQELAEKRRADYRRRLTSDVSRHLLMRLESIKLLEAWARYSQQQSGREYLNPEVVLVSPVKGEELLLPWEENTSSEELRRDWSSAFANRNIRSGEKEEFANRNPKGAADWYHRALRSARNPLETNFARLALGRALMIEGWERRFLAEVEAGQRVGSLAWSPGGDRFAYNGPMGIFVFSVEEGKTTKLETGLEGLHGAPAWSPDGQKIAFAGGRGGEFELRLMENFLHLVQNNR